MSHTRTLVRLAQQRFPMPVESIQYYFVQPLFGVFEPRPIRWLFICHHHVM